MTFGVIVLADIQKEQRLPNSREWLGFVIVFTMLSAGSDLRIPLAYGMAVLVMVSVLLSRGPEALEFVLGKVTKAERKKPRKPSPEAKSQTVPKPHRA
jgi:hypothetical protein